eukprot:3109240-Rhodomonas_salina.1
MKVKVGKTHPDTPSGTPDSGAKSVTFSAPDIMKELDCIRTLVTHAPPSDRKRKQGSKGGGGDRDAKKSKRVEWQ